MFNGMLRRAIDAAQRYQRQFAVLFIDLDRFKVINDSLGHDAGDMLLVEIGGRLRRALRSSDVVARLGGDEFVVILEEAAERHEVERIAGELSVRAQPAAAAERPRMPHHGLDRHRDVSVRRLRHADADQERRHGDVSRQGGRQERLPLLHQGNQDAVDRAADAGERACAARWSATSSRCTISPRSTWRAARSPASRRCCAGTIPNSALVSPGQFIPLAEETGLIVPIGRWVLKEACAQNMAWQRRGLRPVTMAVNLSPRQFADAHLLHDVDEALLASGMSPVLLQLEVTESMVMRNVSRAIKVLDAIQSRGIRLAIDDFGTGYSSMSLMKQFPIDTIKIDRSFVRDLPIDSEDQAIAQAIISMGKALGMTVIAEGVETVEQEAFLRSHACDEMQGFLFSKPLPAREMADLLRAEAQLPRRRCSPKRTRRGSRDQVRAERRCRLTAADAGRGPSGSGHRRLARKIIRPRHRRLAGERLEEDVRAGSIGRPIGQSELGAPFGRQRLRRMRATPSPVPTTMPAPASVRLRERHATGEFADHAFELQSRRWMHSIS